MLQNVFFFELDEYGYVMATIPSNVDREVPAIGFIAHVDTSPDASGKDIKPQIIPNYDGNDIVLNKEKGIVLRVSEFPELKQYAGQTLITTDGTTLLGADDKAGVAEIMYAAQYMMEHPDFKHGDTLSGTACFIRLSLSTRAFPSSSSVISCALRLTVRNTSSAPST